MTISARIINLNERRMRDELSDHSRGYVSIHRSLEDASFSDDPMRGWLWVRMIMKAAHKPTKTVIGDRTVQLQPGQFVSGERQLEKETGVSRQTVRTSLKFFEREGMIQRDTSARNGTIFTIVNYCVFQGKSDTKTNPPLTHLSNPSSNPPLTHPEGHVQQGVQEIAESQSTNLSTHGDSENQPVYNKQYITIPNGIVSTEGSVNELLGDQSNRLPTCPHQELLRLWAEIIPETVQHDPSSWTSSRAGYRNLAARWKAGFKLKNSRGEYLYTDRESGIEWWGKFFRYLRNSDFLMSQFRGFSLEWIVKAANFNKAKEGNYHV